MNHNFLQYILIKMSIRLGNLSLNGGVFAQMFIVPLINTGYTDGITENIDFNNMSDLELTHITEVYNRIYHTSTNDTNDNSTISSNEILYSSMRNIQQNEINYEYEERPKFDDEISKYTKGKN